MFHKHVLYALRDAPAAECPKLLHSVAHLVRYAFHVRVNLVLEVTDVPVYALYAVSELFKLKQLLSVIGVDQSSQFID